MEDRKIEMGIEAVKGLLSRENSVSIFLSDNLSVRQSFCPTIFLSKPAQTAANAMAVLIEEKTDEGYIERPR